MGKKLPITAMVVGLNESHLLHSCLKGISFCDEILYFDLGSSDNSLDIAKAYGANVIIHERVLSCEWIHSKFSDKTRHEWVLITDPDEVVDPELENEIRELFIKGIPAEIAALMVPWIFYFKHHKLKGTTWGGVNKRVLLVNNKKFVFTPQIHIGRKPVQGYKYMELQLRRNNVIHHYWIQSYAKLVEKHLRYLKNEGSARFDHGVRTSVKQILLEPFRQFRYCFFIRKGFKDGLLGFMLSLFWAWYQTAAMIEVYKVQNENDKHK